jgi:hypothetical protein
VLGLAAALFFTLGNDELPRGLDGPGRFCGYAPIIDLVAGEHVQPLEGGIHSGSFRWEGSFGTLDVRGMGWASKPRGEARPGRTSAGQILFGPRRERDGYVVAIWNGRNGSAYFHSPTRFTPAQLSAVQRVSLFDELGPKPENCKLSTIFVWE